MSINLFSRVPSSYAANFAALSTIPPSALQIGSDCWVQSPLSLWVWNGTAWELSFSPIQSGTLSNVAFSGALGSFNLNITYQVVNKEVMLLVPSYKANAITATTITATIPNLSPPAVAYSGTCWATNNLAILLGNTASKFTLSTSSVLTIYFGAGVFAALSLLGSSGFDGFMIKYLTT